MKEQRIIIIGAGGMAREVASAIRARNRVRSEYKLLGYVVSDLSKLNNRDSTDQVLGGLEWLSTNRNSIDAVAVGIGTPELRISVADEVAKVLPDAFWPSIFHPSAEFEEESANVGDGVFIGAGFVGTVNLRFERLALCNFGCTVGHETVIGRGAVVNPGSNISGGVTIGSGALVGTGAQVLQYLTLGENCVVGAGAVVTKDVAPGITVVGTPAKPLHK